MVALMLRLIVGQVQSVSEHPPLKKNDRTPVNLHETHIDPYQQYIELEYIYKTLH